MSHKRYMVIFAISLLFFAAMFIGFNILTDPFGVFGDVIMDWYGYDMTMNPRVAKIGYLDKHHAEYDSFLIGCSKTSSFPDELMTRYFGGDRFYNMFTYGGDTYDTEMTVKYALENYGAKQIVINLGLEELVRYNRQNRDRVKDSLHGKVEGAGLVAFYGRFMLLNPSYGISKITAAFSDGYMPNAVKVFNAETGAYDKRLRDIEPIGDIGEYLDKYPNFSSPLEPNKTLPEKDNCLASIKRIVDMCDDAGVTLTVIISPEYYIELDMFYADGELLTFLRELADITPYWDFTGYHSISYEPRYFYDVYHFRNAVGAMMLARMFDDGSIYMPEDFGYYVTRDNVERRLEKYSFSATQEIQARMPILMYHHIVEKVTKPNTEVTPGRFEEQISAMREAGINAITCNQLIDYVEKGTALPPRPVLITFDDGYESNITYGVPILSKYDMRATVNIIGVSVGTSSYRDTGIETTPKFTWEQARSAAGVISIQSHGYDVHQFPEYDSEDCRDGAYQKDWETEKEYIDFFRADFGRSRQEIEENLGTQVNVYAYPYGKYSDINEILLTDMGVKATLTVESGENIVIKGLPQSLRLLRRLNVTESMDITELIDFIVKE